MNTFRIPSVKPSFSSRSLMSNRSRGCCLSKAAQILPPKRSSRDKLSQYQPTTEEYRAKRNLLLFRLSERILSHDLLMVICEVVTALVGNMNYLSLRSGTVILYVLSRTPFLTITRLPSPKSIFLRFKLSSQPC